MKRLVAFLLAVSVCFGLMATTALGATAADDPNFKAPAIIVTMEKTVKYGDESIPEEYQSVLMGYYEDPMIFGELCITDNLVENYDDALKTYDVYIENGKVPAAIHPQSGKTVPIVFLARHDHSVSNWTKGDEEHSGKCDTCGMTVKEEHTWNTEYGKNGKQHWRVCSDCGYEETKADHVGFDDGVCDTCHYAAKVNITFDDGVNTPAAKEYECGTDLPVPSSKNGYKFDGWLEDGKPLTETKIVPAMDGKTYTAKWTATGPSDKPIVPPEDEATGGVGKDDFADSTGGNLTEDDKTTIKGSEISVGTEDRDAANKLATEAAKDPELVDKAVEDLKKIQGNENLTKDDIVFVGKPVLTITAKSYKEGDKVIVMDISGRIQVYARAKNGTEVPVNKSKEMSEAVTIVVGLPSIFHREQNVFVGHKDYQYKAKSVGDGKFSFINRHRFSDFEFGLQDKAVASNSAYADEFEYLNFKTAAQEAKKGETLTIKSNCSENLDLEDGVKVTLAKDVKFTGKINDESVELSSDSVYTVGGSTTDKTGGSGGGSSKPSIKPGTTTTPTDPITNPEDQTGTGTVAGFSDVAASAWYADAVKYVVDRGLFGGVGSGRFAPDANMTRAMMWTVLARYKGVDTSTGSNWYEAARTWAMQQNISDGTMADGNVTREQFVTMLWRLSGEPAANNSASFTDNGRVSAYAKTAVDWAVAQGIVNGYNDGSFRPQGSATRAEVAKMLMVFCVTSEG